VRIAAVQYLLRPIGRFEDFASQVEFFVRSAKEYRSHFVLFPEFFTMQLLSYINEPAPALAVRRLAQLAPDYEELFMRLAQETGIYIIAGTHPVIQRGKVFNAAHLFTPNGQVFRQKKVHLTPTESGPYQLSRGHGLYLYHTDFGNIAILVCYDVEFPEVARVMAEAGAEILFVPSCTDGREGFCRVRYCAQARAIENQIYVAMTGTVGNLPLVPCMATNYGQAAILTPSDYKGHKRVEADPAGVFRACPTEGLEMGKNPQNAEEHPHAQANYRETAASAGARVATSARL
jgi:predicted amidohydrolase